MKRKIVFVVNNFGVGGVERFLHDLWLHLDSNQIELTVISVWGSGVLSATYQQSGISVHWAGSRLVYNSENPLLKLYFLIIAPLTWCRIVSLLRRIQPETVMTCLTQADILGISAAWLCRIPQRIIRQADVKPLHPVIKWIKQIFSIRLSTGIIVNSVPTGEFMQHYFGVSATRVIVIPNGIDMGKFAKLADQPLQISNPTIGFLGRLESIKGIQYFVQSIKMLKEDFSLSPRVMVFGDGGLRNELEKYAHRYQLDRIELQGEVLDPLVALKEIDILVIPSMSEGFGFVLLEGLATGKVIVASDLPVFRYLIQSGVNGWLFPVGDTRALAVLLHRLIQNPQELARTRSEVIDWLQKHGQQYDLSTIAKRYQDILLS